MKDKLVRNFVIGTFVTLYALVSVISTIHVIDFFELSNPYWLAVTLAIGFEIGAAASLASLVILKKMNKTLVWALFITITLMQMQGNMYYAFKNISNYETWSQLFNLIEEDAIYQKRILAFVSGAILPLIALGFIKSLIDYIKPDEQEEHEALTDGILGDNMYHMDDFEKAPSNEYFEDIEEPIQPTKEQRAEMLAEMMREDQEDGLYDDWDNTLLDGLTDNWDENLSEKLEQDLINETVPEPFATPEELELQEKPWWEGPEGIKGTNGPNDEFDGLTMGQIEPTSEKEDMLDILGLEIDDENVNPTSVGSIVQKMSSPHLPTNEAKTEDELWNEAMAKKAKEDMESFIKNKNANK
jgi:hypothetical protein